MLIGFGISPSRVKASAGVSYDADAEVFFTAASITDATQKIAVNQLVLDLKSYNIWTKMKALYPIVGGSASSHAVNLKTPGTYNLTFSTGWTHASTGMTPSTAYANPNLIPSSVLTTNNTHLSVYMGTDSAAGNKVEIGVGVGGTLVPIMMLLSKYTGNFARSNAYNLTTNQISPSNTDAKGYYIGSRTTSTSHKLYKNSSLIATDSNTNSNSLPNQNIYIGALNSNGSLVQYTDRQFRLISIGDGLTDTESANFYTAVQAYQTTLSRNV